MHILLVEDDIDITFIVKRYLEKEQYQVDTVNNGQSAFVLLQQNQYDLILLDLMIPILSGEELLHMIRKHTNTPVIIVSAKTSEKSKIQGLLNGADDYITKPFSIKELVVRVKTVLRRSNADRNHEVGHGYQDDILSIDFIRREVRVCNKNIAFTNNEFIILQFLIENEGLNLSREQCLDAIGKDSEIYDRNIDTYIKRIRSKIQDTKYNHKYITSTYAVGYKFTKKDIQV